MSAARPSFGAAVGLGLRLVWQNLRLALPVSFALAIPWSLFAGLLGSLAERIQRLGPGLDSLPELASVGLAFAVVLGGFGLVAVLAYPLAYGALAWIGIRAAEGMTPGALQVADRAAQRGPAAIAAFLLGLVAVTAAPAAFAVLAVIGGAAAGPAAAAVFGLLAVAAMVYPGFVYGVRFSLGLAAVFDADDGPVRGLARSAQVVRGNFWFVSGYVLLFALGGNIAGSILGSPLEIAGALAGGARGFALRVAGTAIATTVATAVFGVSVGVAYSLLARAGRTLDEQPPNGSSVSSRLT